jgi:hypothetical protein
MNNQVPQAPPPFQPQRHNPYDFINNPQAPSKKSLLPGGNSRMARLIVVGAGAVILIIVASIVNMLLNRPAANLRKDFVSALSQQSELIRISEIGMKDSEGDKAKDIAITTNLVLTSDYNTLLALAKSSKVNVTKEDLVRSKNTKTDDELAQAKQIGQFDQVFIETIQTQLIAYQGTLKSVFDASTKDSSKQLISTMFENAGLIVELQSNPGAWLLLPATKS